MGEEETGMDGPLDFGAHINPEGVDPAYFQNFRKLAGEKLNRIFNNIDAFAEWYRKAGYSGAVLSQPYFMGHDNLTETEHANDSLNRATKKYDNIYQLASLPTGAGGDEAAAEFERCINNGFNGGALAAKPEFHSLSNESSHLALTDESMEPELELADRTGAPIMVHPKLTDSPPERVVTEFGRIHPIIARESALFESVFDVVNSDVLDRFPELNLVYHHFGGNVSAYMGRIQLYSKGRRSLPHKHQMDYRDFHEKLSQRIYIDTCGFFGYPDPLKTALETFPTTNILFATDAPAEPRSTGELRELVSPIRSLTSPPDARHILYENAIDLLVNI